MRTRLFLAACAAILSWCSATYIFQNVPTSADENSYLFQAHTFAAGHIARPAPPLPEQFDQHMIILDDEAGWLSRYPPAHPLWLAPSAWIGSVYPLTALAAAIGIVFLCAAAAALGASQLAIGAILLLSPNFIFMYGTYLSHTSGFMAVCMLLWAYIRWQKGGGVRFAALAGLAWSLFLLNRTYTALLMAVPFGLDALWQLARTRTKKSFVETVSFAAAAGVGIVAYLIYNKLAVGDAFTATYLYYEPSENLGFGPRRTQGHVVHHTLQVGLATLWDHITSLNLWWWGFPASLLLLAAFACVGWSRRWTLLLLASALAVWFGYVAFWYPGVENVGGPVYYFETVPALALLGSLGIARISNRLSSHTKLRAFIFGAATLTLLWLAATFIVKHAPEFIAQQTIRRTYWDTLDRAPAHSIIFVSDYPDIHKGEQARNPDGLDSDPLVLISKHDWNVVPMRIFSNRTPFLLSANDPTHLQPLTPPSRIVLTRNASHTARRTGKNEPVENGPVRNARIARAERDEKNWLLIDPPIALPAGTFTIRFEGDCAGVSTTHPTLIRLTLPDTNLNATVTGEQSNSIATFSHTFTNLATHMTYAVRYGGSGTVRIDRVVWEEQPAIR